MSSLGREQFEQLFRTEINRLHNFARQFVPDADTAMDICQNVFILLWDKRETIDPSQAVRSYLYTSVKNRCLNYIRDQKKYRSRVLDLDCADIDIADVFDSNDDATALEQRIAEALLSLPEKCRQVFEMSRFREMKYREIADELQISQKTVEAHMSKAIRTLREILSVMILLLLWITYLFCR